MLINAYRIALLFLGILAISAGIIAFYLINTPIWACLFLPWIYLIFLWLTADVSWSKGPSPFLAVCHITAFLRYAAFPALAAVNGGYTGRSRVEPDPGSYTLAVIVMGLEVIVAALVIRFFERRYHRRRMLARMAEARTVPRWWLLLVLVVAATLVAIEPGSLGLINVGFPRLVDDGYEDIGALSSLAAMVLVSFKVFLFLKIIDIIKVRPQRASITPWLAGLAGIFNVGIFIGSNRMTVVLTAAVSFYMLFQKFGRRSILPAAIGLSLLVPLFILITEQRQYAQISSDPVVNLADTIQSYNGGVYNVAIGLEVPKYYPESSNPIVFIYDILRSAVGFNVLVKDWNIYYSNIYFNWRMFTHIDRRSQIMPLVAQAALFVPIIFAPLLSAGVIALAYLMLRAAHRTTSIELRYALILVTIRFGFFWGQNTMNLMNFISLNLIIPFLLISIHSILKRSPVRKRSV